VPPGVVTLTFPVAPLSTVAVITYAETTLKFLAFTPPNNTALALLKLIPLMVIRVPLLPFCGVKDVITGDGICGWRYINPLDDAMPFGVDTTITPEAPESTTALTNLW